MFLNKPRAQQIMEKHGIDALVATTPENVAYLTGFWMITSFRHRARQIYAVISKKEAAPDIIIPRGIADHPLQGGTWIRQFYVYEQFYFADVDLSRIDDESKRLFQTIEKLPIHKNALEALIQCLKDNGLTKGCIGVDQGTGVTFLGNALEQNVRGIKTKPAYDIFREVRTIKTPEEVERIRAATEVTEKALSKAIKSIGEGVTEKEVALVFMETIARNGGIPTITAVGSGPRGSFPNVEPSGKKIRRGDSVRFDVGCIFRAYHADIARTAVLGPPSPKQQRYHDALMAGEGGIIEAIRPGAVIADLFEMGVAETRKHGIPDYQRHHCGHGTGAEGYDPPLISPGNQARIEKGMVLCIETPYYEPGYGGFHIEDIVEVTSEGTRRLTQLERKLFVV